MDNTDSIGLIQQLTSIKNLLGRQGGHFLIFGLLARMEDGAFYLEDLDDKVELDLTQAVRPSSLPLTTDIDKFRADARIGFIHRRIVCTRRWRLYRRFDLSGERDGASPE